MSLQKSIIILSMVLFNITYLYSGEQENKAKNNVKESHDKSLLLNGKTLTIYELESVAKNQKEVEISLVSLKKIEAAHQLLLLAAKKGHEIYGLNRGVGLNKDISIFQGDTLRKGARKASEEFNRKLLNSHSVGIGPELTESQVRGVMVSRLNTLLVGVTGCSPSIAIMYREFLNRGIHPVVYSRGSIGEADIALLPAIGLAMMGEGTVRYKGEIVSGKEALKAENLTPLTFIAKDALSILSSNAYSAAYAALMTVETERFLTIMNLVFSLSLEALNGNISPFLKEVQNIRPYANQLMVASEIRSNIYGSYLWKTNKNRVLQDPLSFRNVSQVHGAVRASIRSVSKLIEIQLNSSDDNPAVLVGVKPEEERLSQVAEYFVDDGNLYGVVVPTANFEPIRWVLGVESLALSLAHASALASQRILRLGSTSYSQLPRFLSYHDKGHGFGTLEKTVSALNTEIRHLSDPVSLDYLSTAGGVEDVATNAPLVISRLENILENLRYIFAIELLYGAQAIDLRIKNLNKEKLSLGKETYRLYEAFRFQVPFNDDNSPLREDIEKAMIFLKNLQI